MYKVIDSSSYEQHQQTLSPRQQYTREQLLALQASPLVSKPVSLPPLSSWITGRELTSFPRSGPNNQPTIGVHNRFIQPKASISTPSRSSNNSKLAASSGQKWNHRQGLLEGHHYHQHHSTGSNDTNSSIFDDEGIPEWMDDNPSELTKDEQTEKMVLDSSQMEEWKLRMKQIDDDKVKKNDSKKSRTQEDNNGAYLLAGRGNNENRWPDDDERMSTILALEGLHLTTNNSLDNAGTYSSKSISVHELFQHQHLPSSPSLSPSSQQQSSTSSAINTTSFLISPRDDQIGSFGHVLPNQSMMSKDNGNFMNNAQMNVIQQEQHHQYQRSPPGFMLPSPEHQSRMKLQSNDAMLSSVSPGTFPTANGGDNARPPPMMTYSFSTGTTGSHHYHSMLQHHHQQPMLSPSFLPVTNSNNTTNNHSMISPFRILPQHIPSHCQQHPSMVFNQSQSMLQQQQQYHSLQQQQYLHQFVPPSMHHQQQHHHPHYSQQTHSFPSQLLHHPYQPQPLVSDLNK